MKNGREMLRDMEIAMAPHLYASEFRMTPNLGDVVNVEHEDVVGAVAIGVTGFRHQRDLIVRSRADIGNKLKIPWC